MGKNKSGRKAVIFGIRNKIFLCFIAPVLFMVLVGYVSYHYAETGMNKNFLDSATQTVSMAMDYLDMSNTFISSEATRYTVDSGVESYVVGMPGKDVAEKSNYYYNERLTLLSAQTSNPFINNIHIVTKEAYPMLSTAVVDKMNGVYDEYVAKLLEQSPEGVRALRWVSSHDVVDQAFGLKKEEYLYCYQVQDAQKLAYIIIDVNRQAILDILTGMDFGTGSYVGVVTSDGVEMSIDCVTGEVTENIIFTDKDFYAAEFAEPQEGQEQPAEEEEPDKAKYSYVKYNEQDYLFIYRKSELNNMVICALIPVSTVTAQAQSIKLITVIMVIVAAVIAAVIGTLIANGIQRNMKRISKRLDEVAKGDLTVGVDAKGKDEFQFLAQSASNMVNNNKNLVVKLSDTAEDLAGTAKSVGEVSEDISGYSAQINGAIDEISEGIVDQEKNASDCMDVTKHLSDRIKEINADISEIESAIRDTEAMIGEGTEIVNRLAVRAAETSELSAQVGENIVKLQKDAYSISEFVETISAISDQTNLLSLNASIEAARAGDAGRGFAVVAEEIRSLADSSSAATVEIDRKISNIDHHSKTSVESAQNAEEVVKLQQSAVSEVIEVFEKIRSQMGVLVDALQKISESAAQADAERRDVVHAMDGITQIIKQTSDSSSKVRDIASSLMDSAGRLEQTTNELDDDMNGLREEISAFHIG